MALWQWGGATFAVLVFVNFFKRSFLEARGTEIAAATPETLISATILYFGSTVPITLILAMFASSFVGAWVGSHLAVKHGSDFIKKAMVGIAIVMVLKVIIDLL